MSDLQIELKKAILLLRNASPEGFDRFVSLYNDLALDALKALSEAPTDQVLIQQGRCQQLRSTLRMFVECDKVRQQPNEPTPQ